MATYRLTNSAADFQTLKFPVFGLARYRDHVLVSGGAGAKNVGIQDKLIVYEAGVPLTKITHEEKVDYNLQYMVINEKVDSCQAERALGGKLRRQSASL